MKESVKRCECHSNFLEFIKSKCLDKRKNEVLKQIKEEKLKGKFIE